MSVDFRCEHIGVDGLEVIALRYVAYCEEISGMVCNKRFAEHTRPEVLDAALDHLESVHGRKDEPRLREDIQMLIYEQEEASPPIA